MTAQSTAPLRNRPHPVRPPIPRRSAPRRRCGARAPTENRNPFAMPGVRRRCSPGGGQTQARDVGRIRRDDLEPSMTPRVRGQQPGRLGSIGDRVRRRSRVHRQLLSDPCHRVGETLPVKGSNEALDRGDCKSPAQEVAGSYHRALSELGRRPPWAGGARRIPPARRVQAPRWPVREHVGRVSARPAAPRVTHGWRCPKRGLTGRQVLAADFVGC